MWALTECLISVSIGFVLPLNCNWDGGWVRSEMELLFVAQAGCGLLGFRWFSASEFIFVNLRSVRSSKVEMPAMAVAGNAHNP